MLWAISGAIAFLIPGVTIFVGARRRVRVVGLGRVSDHWITRQLR
jgi:hypothetical protein